MIWLYFIAGVSVGFNVSLYILKARVYKNISGNLKQANDGEETYLFVELNTTLDKIMNKDYVIFKVDRRKRANEKETS